jgi:hypothetical protein
MKNIISGRLIFKSFFIAIFGIIKNLREIASIIYIKGSMDLIFKIIDIIKFSTSA